MGIARARAPRSSRTRAAAAVRSTPRWSTSSAPQKSLLDLRGPDPRLGDPTHFNAFNGRQEHT